jgi:hypothetical protein
MEGRSEEFHRTFLALIWANSFLGCLYSRMIGLTSEPIGAEQLNLPSQITIFAVTR